MNFTALLCKFQLTNSCEKEKKFFFNQEKLTIITGIDFNPGTS